MASGTPTGGSSKTEPGHRDFNIASEPRDDKAARARKAVMPQFVVQLFVAKKHDVRRLHYDFRLEINGTLKSWAIPRGPSLDPRDKRIAVQLEDQALEYADFEGEVSAGHFLHDGRLHDDKGAGDVIVWDRGIWKAQGDALAGYRAGKLTFTLMGEKLAGDWTLVRNRLKGSGNQQQWLLIKEQDDKAAPIEQYDVLAELPHSVISGVAVGEGLRSAKMPHDDIDTLPGKPARRGRVPATLMPQLATPVERPPAGNWIYEIKFDGYRLLARVRKGEVRLFTRNGNDWSSRLPRVQKALSALHIDNSWLDGEVVVLNEHGVADFQALQNAFERGHNSNIIYYVFDAPYLNGRDLRSEALEVRRDALQQIIAAHPQRLLRFSEALDAGPAQILARAGEMSLEGVIGKRAGSHYASRRSASWIKLKCRQRQEFVIVGYTQPRGARSGFGALLLAINDDEGLRYAGLVATGFSVASLQQLQQQLHDIERASSPLRERAHLPAARGVHWVEPVLVAEVDFAEWTRAGLVRQASFLGLRDDKPAAAIVREDPAAAAASVKKVNRVVVAGVAISHPHRIIDKVSGTDKETLARFYESIAARLLRQLDKRAVSLLRAPEGVEGEQFFQKHAERLSIPNIRHLDETLDPGHASLMEIDSVEALIGAVQMGTIELHTWNATSDSIETPDRLVLDLDPDPALPWRQLIDATHLLLRLLDELGLDAWLKTSGGKGMHVVVPLARHHDWALVKNFARAVSQFMARQWPDRFTATMGQKNRVGKIFIDYLRNNRGASTVAAYSLRALPGLPVSVPIARNELDALQGSGQWTLATLPQRLDALRGDPWRGYGHRQRITHAMWQKIDSEPP